MTDSPRDEPTKAMGDSDCIERESLVDESASRTANGIPSQPLQPASALEGSEINNRYLLIQRIGAGAYGEVYRATDKVLNRSVAIKLLKRFELSSQVDAFTEEARILAKLDHPAIVPVYDHGQMTSGNPYIVYKFIEGGSLNERISAGSLSISDAARMIIQLAQALDHMHRNAVMHRDIKPGNILTTLDGNAVLADFGLAMHESKFGRGSRFVGTAPYMSPEQARFEGHRVDGRSDIYSLGVVLYKLLSGRLPFSAEDQEELLDCIRNVEVRPPRQLNAGIPRELERICLKALAKKASDRYSTAADFAEDLIAWQTVEVPLTVRTEERSARPSERTVSDSRESQGSLNLSDVGVIPHGLRPFSSNDADFFKYLLPGPRDRNGIPESVSFWTTRLINRDPASTFRVGVLLGPSGSGKSSLMQAAVLPVIREQVQAVYLEAKPQLLEESLLKQLRQFSPSLDTEATLREALGRLREQRAEKGGKKLVIIIDQFEQWLHYHRAGEATELHDALRQCDGRNVQAVLLVRDDFMLGLSGFMDRLEEPLLQNQNFATMEPFGEVHAGRVLAAFGRAFGAVSAEPTAEQAAFIEQTVGELSRIGALEPVQLALLSETVKDKPWTSATLKQLGGIQGLGVGFLNERLVGGLAHPMLRANALVVRRLLQELLPAGDTTIKPPACSESELLERLDGIADESLLRKLLQLLDTEVRLITPTSSPTAASTARSTAGSTGSAGSAGTAGTSASATSDPAYQLTHDYLVPTTRKWLALQSQGTRAGRVQHQLRDIATAWNAEPSARKLPTLIEWLAIRWFTTPATWLSAERLMMQTAARRLALVWGSVSMLTLIVGVFAYRLSADKGGKQLAQQLFYADPSNVVSVLEKIAPQRTWVEPHLDDLASGLSSGSGSNVDSEKIERSKLNLALASFGQNPEQKAYLLARLGSVKDQDLPSIAKYLSLSTHLDNSELASRLQASLERGSSNALPLAALLAARSNSLLADRSGNTVNWDEVALPLSSLLLKKPAAQLAVWPELLRPVGQHFVPVLLEQAEQLNASGPNSSANKLDSIVWLISEFGRGDARSLARAVSLASDESFTGLLDNSGVPQQEMATELRRRFVEITTPVTDEVSKRPALDPRWLERFGAWDGMLFERCAWAEKVPWDQVDDLLNVMQAVDFLPRSLRPYTLDGKRFAAVTWDRQAGTFQFADELTSEQLQLQFSEHRAQNFELVDFASIDAQALPEPAKPRWLAVWRSADRDVSSQQLSLDVSEREDSGGGDEKDDYVALRQVVAIDSRGDLLRSTLWEKPDAEQFDLHIRFETRLACAFGDLYPGNCLMDLRCESILATQDRGNSWKDGYYFIDEAEKRDATDKRSYLLRSAQCLSQAGDSQAAIDTIEAQRISTGELAAGDLTKLAMAHARLSNQEQLGAVIIVLGQLPRANAVEMAYIQLSSAILSDDGDTVVRQLGALRQEAHRRAGFEAYFLRGLALVASSKLANPIVDAAWEELLQAAPRAMASDKHSDLASILLEVDFDGVRGRPEWRKLLTDLWVAQRYASTSYYDPNHESKFLLAQPTGEHRRAALELLSHGYQPRAWHAVATFDGVKLTSTWRRASTSPQVKASAARRTAGLAWALARLGESDVLQDGLNGKLGRDVESYLTTQSHLFLDADVLVPELRSARSTDLQTALVLTLGGYQKNQLESSDFQYAYQRIAGWASQASQARLMNSARWCLESWGEELPSLRDLSSQESERDWYVNSIGMQMIQLDPPALVRIGRPERGYDCRWVRLGMNFDLSATEVTRAQYAEFLEDARMQAWMSRKPQERRQSVDQSDDWPWPQTASWQQAIRFCQWLNEREGTPPEQWCYENVWSQNESDIKLAANYRQRTGYRLANSAEFEWACSAGDFASAWHWGNDPQLCYAYEWTLPHSDNRLHRVGELRPNPFGFFDISANAAEWCDDKFNPPQRPAKDFALSDIDNKVFPDRTDECIRRDGRFSASVDSARSNSLKLYASRYLSHTSGFRIARTRKN